MKPESEEYFQKLLTMWTEKEENGEYKNLEYQLSNPDWFVRRTCEMAKQHQNQQKIPIQFINFMRVMHNKFVKRAAIKGNTSTPWKGFDRNWLIKRLIDEMEEFFENHDSNELIDIANICMFIFVHDNPDFKGCLGED